MSAKVITFGVEKGGAAKTTTCGIAAHLLSKQSKVLVVDMDSQGNVTELLTGMDSAEFIGRGILEAIQETNTDPYIVAINDNLHILAGCSDLALLSRWLWGKYKGDKSLALQATLSPILDNYDYILIDTPPALGDQTINALAASDYVCAMYETSKFCYSALGRFLRTIGEVKASVNPKIQLAGIVISMIDNRRADNKALLELVQEEYPEHCFSTVIYRRAATGRLSINGFANNPELNEAVKQFIPLLDEVMKKCQ